MGHPNNLYEFVLLYGYVVIVFLIGMLGVITTSRWFICRLCGFSEQTPNRLAAFWPLIMFLVLFSFPYYSELRSDFWPGIAVAFGMAFSIANLRIASWYSRGIGAVFSLLYGFILFEVLMNLKHYK